MMTYMVIYYSSFLRNENIMWNDRNGKKKEVQLRRGIGVFLAKARPSGRHPPPPLTPIDCQHEFSNHGLATLFRVHAVSHEIARWRGTNTTCS